MTNLEWIPLNPREKELFALLYACGDPVEEERLAEAMELNLPGVQRLLEGLDQWLERLEMPIRLVRMGSQVQLCTREEYAGAIRRVLEIRRGVPLSQAAMEALAVIAYNQPVTRGFVEQVRGVDSSGVVSLLVQRGLIEEAGRMELPGRPIAYRTTPLFLRCFGLESLEELPSVAYEAQREAESADEPAAEAPAGD